MIELIKYISPVALLTIFWTIFQHYQKRADERKMTIKTQKLSIYNSIHLALNEIEFAILNFMSTSRVSMIKVNHDLEKLNSMNTELGEKIKQLEVKLQKLSDDYRETNDFEIKFAELDDMSDEINRTHHNTLNTLAIDRSKQIEEFLLFLKCKAQDLNKARKLILLGNPSLELKLMDLINEINLTSENYSLEAISSQTEYTSYRTIATHIKKINKISFKIKLAIQEDVD